MIFWAKKLNPHRSNNGKKLKLGTIKKAITQSKMKKTPGQDGIKNIMIINCPDKIHDCILKIFIASIYQEYIPLSWQIANSVIIAKPGKDNYSNTKSFRINLLTSNLLKLLETLDWMNKIKFYSTQSTIYIILVKSILWQVDLKIEQSMNPNQYMAFVVDTPPRQS